MPRSTIYDGENWNTSSLQKIKIKQLHVADKFDHMKLYSCYGWQIIHPPIVVMGSDYIPL
jgi:hypothetical protein